MTIGTTAIDGKGYLLPRYTCDGENISPPLTFSEIPLEAESLVLIMDDPDAPDGTFTHWLLYDMTPGVLQITEAAMPMTGKTGTNSFGTMSYGGACPPAGTHRYYFKLFALDTMLDVPDGAVRETIEQAMEGHVIDTAEVIGKYARTANA
jgi:Raf kinase inhibitor-like YbhB/YbcL family protein